MDSAEAAPAKLNEAAGGGPDTGLPGRHLDHSLAHSLAWRAVADWSSQIVSWTAFLIIVRLLSPADFGIVAMAIVVFSYLRIFGEFGIPVTVVTLRDLTEDQLAQINTVAALLGLACFGSACLLARPVAFFFKTPQVGPVLIVACITAISLGLRAVPEGLLERDLRLNLLSVMNAVRDVVSAVATLAMAFLGMGYWSLVVGNVLGFTARSLIILAIRPHRFAWPRFESIRGPLRFGRHVLVSVTAWTAYSTLDSVTAGRVLGKSALGFYGLAWNLANVPLEKVTSLVTTVVPSYLAAVQNDPPALRRYFRTLTEIMALAAFAPTIGLGLVAAEVVPIALGQKWYPSIPALEVLSVYAAVRSVAALLPKVLTAVGNARFVMWDDLAALALLPCAFYVGTHWGITGIAWAWVAAYPLVAVPLYWKTLKTTQLSLAEYFRCLRPALDSTIAMVVVVEAVRRFHPSGMNTLLQLLLEVGAGGIAYVGTVWLFHRPRALAFLEMAVKLRKGPAREAPAAAAAGEDQKRL